jgi:transposase
LVTNAVQRFDIVKVMADMSYSSRSNHQLARDLGFEIFVPYESNTVEPPDDGSGWTEDWRRFRDDPEGFFREYHRRSNVESSNSSIKRLFPSELRSETFAGHVNELLCKLICYNLVVSARQMRIHGLRPDFLSEVSWLDDVVRGVVEMPISKAA